MHGHVHSNYAGVTGLHINPTSIVNSKLYFDLNLIGLHLNVDNDVVYLAKDEYKFARFLSIDSEYPKHGDDNRIYYDFFNTNLKNAFTQIKILGPSVMYATIDRGFSLSTSVRNIVSGSDIPYEIAKFGVEGFDYYPLHRINFIDNQDFRAAGVSFGEITASYAQLLFKNNRDHITAGISLKALLGFGGAYWYVENIDYMLPNSDTLIVYNVNGSAGFALPVDYTNNDVNFSNSLIKGTGIAFDLGVTYQKKVNGHTNKRLSPCQQPFEPYIYRIGVSLMDLGSIKFKKNTTQVDLVDGDAYWINFRNQDIETVETLVRTVSYQFSGDSTQLVKDGPFSIFLPAAASVQFDWSFNNNLYINATLIHPLVLNKYSLIRPAQLSLTPRFESDFFELAVPISLYEYQYPRIGVSARFSNLVIGTDKLGSFFGFSHFTGMDLYFMVKFPLIKGRCRSGKGGYECGNNEFDRVKRSFKRLIVP